MPSEQMSENDKVGNLKNNPSSEKLEISVKTFFGYEITVRLGGNYEVLTGGIKGLIDKILWFLFAPTLESRKAAVQKTLENNNSQVPNEKTKSNNGDEQNSPKTSTTSDYLNKTNQFLGEKKSEDDAKKSENSSSERLEQSKNSKKIEPHNNAHEESSPKIDYNNNIKIVDDPDDSNFQLLSNEKDSIGNQTNINNDNRNNSFIKDRESEKQINNEISENSNSRRDKNINDTKGITNERRKESSKNIADRTRSKFDLKNKNINDIKGITNKRKKKFLNNDLVNIEIEQAKNNFALSDEECNEIRKRINTCAQNGLTKPSIIGETINRFIEEKYGNEDGNNNINNKLNINNHDKIDKDRAESGNADNDFSLFKDVKNDEFSIFNNKDNKINFVDGQNSARIDMNNMCHNSSVLSEEELAEIEGQINDLRKIGSYTEEDLILLKPNFIKEAIEKKKNDKKNAEYQQQVENIIKQSKSENENIEKKYKEAESNLEKMIPNGYRVTSFDKGDGIIGDGNCFYRAIAKLEKGNQEEYGDVRKKISDEIGKYCPESNEEQAEKIDNNLKDLIQNYAVEHELECSLNKVDDLLAVLMQIREHVGNADNKNRYAGHIEAYFYARATEKVVIIYDSIGQMTAFIPDKEGKDVQVKSLSAKETEDQQKIENFVKNNNIDVAAAVKLACNTVGPHYEAIVPVDVKN